MKEYKIKINGNDYAVAINSIEAGIASVSVNGNQYKVEVENEIQPASPRPVVARAAVAATPVVAPKAGGTGMKSPLPGVILDVKAREGDMVKEGQVIAILEAMKMENNIDAHRSGKLTRILKRQGDAVLEGDELFIIE